MLPFNHGDLFKLTKYGQKIILTQDTNVCNKFHGENVREKKEWELLATEMVSI